MEVKQTPLIELLVRVPQDARLIVEHDQHSSSSYPVGRLCHEAATALRTALAEQQEPVCPRPGNGRSDSLTMAECIVSGECGCTVAGHAYAQLKKKRIVIYTCPVCLSSLERQE